MTTSEWISVIALMISSGGFALQARLWFMNGPRLHLSVIGDAIAIPDDGRGKRVALIVINRGTEPTVLTHMVGFVYGSKWKKFRKNPSRSGIVNSTNIPSRLDVNTQWMGEMLFYDNQELLAARQKGNLYVGVIAAHKDRAQLIRVPPPKTSEVPTGNINPTS
jgi:hypothetical protein